MPIYNFSEFVNESYLKGGRQPIYHSTYHFVNILESDILKVNKPTFDDKSKEYISFTRNRGFQEHGFKKFMLDADLLIKDGYVPKPVDELGTALMKAKPHRKEEYKEYTKSNPESRLVNHNIEDLKTGVMFSKEAEYEERIYKNITNLGKYVIEIVLDNKYLNKYKPELTQYIEKYPHIIVTNEKGDVLFSKKDIKTKVENNVLVSENKNKK